MCLDRILNPLNVLKLLESSSPWVYLHSLPEQKNPYLLTKRLGFLL